MFLFRFGDGHSSEGETQVLHVLFFFFLRIKQWDEQHDGLKQKSHCHRVKRGALLLKGGGKRNKEQKARGFRNLQLLSQPLFQLRRHNAHGGEWSSSHSQV